VENFHIFGLIGGQCTEHQFCPGVPVNF
ncbi:hypothetical protein DOY81_009553, partial [Sarcophaga bullata]